MLTNNINEIKSYCLSKLADKYYKKKCINIIVNKQYFEYRKIPLKTI